MVHCPDVRTVKRHMDNWAALQRCPAALALLEAATNRWGRDNLLDWPTKLGIIVQKTDPGSIGYVVEALYTRMWRMNQKDPYSANALGDVIAEILWARTYIASFLRKYPELLKLGCNSEASASTNEGASANQSVQMARARIDSPLKFFLQTEGPDKDPTWLQTLPTVALRLAMKHFLDLVQGFYRVEIAGVLRQPRTDRYNFDQFHRGARASKRFWEPFQTALDDLLGSAKGASEEQTAALNASAATAGGASGIDVEGALEDNKKTEATRDDLAAFRAQCELACQRELDSRVVMITAVGSDVEIHASVTRTRLYQNLTEAATVMGFYDVKNSRLCNVFEGQGLTHREPAVDEADFERYVKSILPLMAMGRDVLWVMGGALTRTGRS